MMLLVPCFKLQNRSPYQIVSLILGLSFLRVLMRAQIDSVGSNCLYISAIFFVICSSACNIRLGSVAMKTRSKSSRPWCMNKTKVLLLKTLSAKRERERENVLREFQILSI